MSENTIDQIMHLDPLSLTPKDIDSLIEYMIAQRHAYESGAKPKKASSVDGAQIAQAMERQGLKKKPVVMIKRR